MKKIIGIVGSVAEGIFGVNIKYMQFAAQFGDVHIITPTTPILDLDLLILKGGQDISPVSYGQTPQYILSNNNPYLEKFSNEQLPEYIKKRTPIFGICRGLQELNVAFGGTLTQHIYNHPSNQDGFKEDLVHGVTNRKKKASHFDVNSTHHQAIDKLGEGIEPLLWALDKDKKVTNVIEAIRHTELPIIAVQWHPEEIMDQYSIMAVNYLLNPTQNV